MDAGSKALDLLRHPKIDGDAVRTRITEMQDLVFSAQRALGEAEDENRKQRKEIEELEDRIRELSRMSDLGKDFILWNGLYWLNKIPYCPTCWDVDRKTVRLGGPVTMTGEDIWQCPIHKAHIILGLHARPPQ